MECLENLLLWICVDVMKRYKESEGRAGAFDLMLNYCDAFKFQNFVEGLIR